MLTNPFEPPVDLREILDRLVTACRDIYWQHQNDARRDGMYKCNCELCSIVEEYDKLTKEPQ